MGYLAHIEKAIERLGYIKPEYAQELAQLMGENEDQHPHQLARLFRERGTSMHIGARRATGLRADAEMTLEAADALTQRGLSAPIHGLEATLLNASFAYLREISVEAGRASGRDRFRVDGVFATNCAGCKRLDGQIVPERAVEQIPPLDCEREACGIGLHPSIDFLQGVADRESVERQRKPGWVARLLRRC